MGRIYIVDSMLGRTARWLRILGLNVVYNPSLSDDELIELALRLKATILTRDKGLAAEASRLGLEVLEVFGGTEVERVGFLLRRLGLKPVIDPSRSRCPVCNQTLKEASKRQVVDLVPKAVLNRQDRFWICTGCGKVYWLGSHFRNMKKFLERCLSEG